MKYQVRVIASEGVSGLYSTMKRKAPKVLSGCNGVCELQIKATCTELARAGG